MNFIVHFENIKEAPPVSERVFEKKEQAQTYKDEHPLGKFAAVIPLRGTFGEGL